MELKILFIEDDEKLGQNLKKSFDGSIISGYELKVDVISSFEDGTKSIAEKDFDIVILDLYKDSGLKDEEAGIKVLDGIRQVAFIPVVFYTGHAYKITSLISEIVGVVSKGEGIDALTKEIERIITSKLALLKSQIYSHLKESLRQYFWDIVDAQKDIFIPGENDASIGYLLLRRFANSLSKENIKSLLGDDKINKDNIHPMEFYIYPSHTGEYESGEILVKDSKYFVVLTPDCDFVARPNGKRKADFVLLASAIQFKEFPDHKNYKILKDKKDKTAEDLKKLPNLEGKLKKWIGNNEGEKDRYFFLPGTPFMDNLVLDFQNKSMVIYEDLKTFKRLAKLDTPFAQSMISSFIRYYNRIGFPDLDSNYIIGKL